MLPWLWLIPALPLAGSLLLILGGGRLTRTGMAWIGAGSIGLATLLALRLAWVFLHGPSADSAYSLQLWTWIALDHYGASVTLVLDRLSLVMMLVITGVGFLIHLYATEYMQGEEGYRRFFAYLNLFVAFMLILVLAGDLLVLYLGWEGVGLCSYLLIGHWYRDPANGRAARKAFLVTRVGDAAMLGGMLLFFTQLGSTDIQTLLQRAELSWPVGSGLALAAAGLLLAGAVGKSAQLPLQIWLPDAMAGPTPVSALIHAATMVTAGVYLIARTQVLFALAPQVQLLVGLVGALTLLLAGLVALSQHDIKRALAWSTVSQIGYMFLALGFGALSAALFHLMTHAFFKALLFLAAGILIHALDGERDMRRMGGLWRHQSLLFGLFLAGCASLAALPWVSAGFYSKEQILAGVWSAADGHLASWAGGLWLCGLVGAGLTALYAFRILFLVFFGEIRRMPGHPPGWRMRLPAVLLAMLALGGGAIGAPTLDTTRLSALAPGVEIATLLAPLFGLALACYLYLYRPTVVPPEWFLGLAHRGFGFDRLYETLLLRPYLWLAHSNRQDLLNLPNTALAGLSNLGYRLLSRNQTGLLRWYASATVLGAACLLGTLMLLAEVTP
jgi:NADH-quinone oxidoreductase subunit L